MTTSDAKRHIFNMIYFFNIPQGIYYTHKYISPTEIKNFLVVS